MTLRDIIRSTGLLLCREEYAASDPVRALALRAYAAGVARGREESANVMTMTVRARDPGPDTLAGAVVAAINTVRSLPAPVVTLDEEVGQ